MLVLIKGAGDLATGTACRLHRAGFQIVMTDLEQPTAVRRTVAFSQCIYDGVTQVEGITARRAETSDQAADLIRKGEIPVLADPQAKVRRKLSIDAVVDAILAKKNLGTRITDAPIVLALGPGFTAGVDCHGVIETQRGHHLGRLLLEGSAAPDTGIPGDIGGYTTQRLIRASAGGMFLPAVEIGAQVQEGDVVARVGDTPVYAQMSGMVRGMLPPGCMVTQGMKAGDIDQEAMTVTNKAVMEALDGLPPVKVHCSLLAEEAIHAALWDYAQKNGIRIEGLEKPKTDISEEEEDEAY